MDETPGKPTRKIIRATREIVVSINGEEYDALLIPRQPFIEVDYTKFPEDDPFKRQLNIGKMREVDLEIGRDLIPMPPAGDDRYRITKVGAKRLLESL